MVYYGISLNAGSLAGDIFVNNTLSELCNEKTDVRTVYLTLRNKDLVNLPIKLMSLATREPL